MYYPLIVLGLVCLISPWLGRMSRYEISRKSFDLVGIAGIFFLLAASFGLGMNLVDLLHDIGKVMMVVSFVLGWIALFAGAIWSTIDVLREPSHGLVGKAERA
jgi:vacuolar-type H+-ATPase subunit I/STV1